MRLSNWWPHCSSLCFTRSSPAEGAFPHTQRCPSLWLPLFCRQGDLLLNRSALSVAKRRAYFSWWKHMAFQMSEFGSSGGNIELWTHKDLGKIQELNWENHRAITRIYCHYFPNKPLLNICFALRAQKLERKFDPKQNGTSTSILAWALKRNMQALYWQRMGIRALLGHLLIESPWASYFSFLKHPCGCSPGKIKWEQMQRAYHSV